MTAPQWSQRCSESDDRLPTRTPRCIVRAVRAARAAAIVGGVILLSSVNVSSARVLAAPAVADVLLSDVGPGFTLVSETPGALDSLARTFESEHARLDLNAFPVTDPPGVRQLFQVFSSSNSSFTVVPEPSLALAVWLVPAGSELGDGFASLVFASRDYIFAFAVAIDPASDIDPVSFVRALADRQLAARPSRYRSSPRSSRSGTSRSRRPKSTPEDRRP